MDAFLKFVILLLRKSMEIDFMNIANNLHFPLKYADMTTIKMGICVWFVTE